MALFNRKHKDSSSDDTSDNKKPGWRRPANTAFKQQRLKAWQPILTPKTVLPTLFLIAIIFAPIGGLLIWGSSQVSEMTFDYTNCEDQTPSTLDSPQLFDLSTYSYRLRASDAHASIGSPPQFALINNSANTNDESKQLQCLVEFEVPADLHPGIFLYYKLTNFYQNHRRYVKSLDSDQLKGKAVSVDTLNKGDCKPLASLDDKPIYPCGLIANSLFNDSFSNLNLTNEVNGVSSYNFSSQGIAWPGEAKKYATNTSYHLESIVPPPNWMKRYPNGYTTDNFPDLKHDEHFQNWMRTAGLPTFTKLWGRNDDTIMPKGRYRILIDLNFPVKPYKGTKSFVISTVSWIGGKNPFLGWAYVAAAGVFMLLAIAGTVRHLVKPRRLGDMSLLSWNR